MAIFADGALWSTYETAVTSGMTAVVSVLGAWAVLRRKYSSDSSEIRKDRGEWQWIQAAIAERERAVKELDEANDQHTDDVRMIARLEARLEACIARDSDHDEERERQLGACEERVRSLSEQVLDQKLNNGRLFMELAKLDASVAERLLIEHLRPGPRGKGDEPP